MEPSAGRPAWRVYMLRCRDGSLYTGATNDLERRLAQHAAGRGARYTRSRLPVTLAYDEVAADRAAALRREAALKRLTRAQKLALAAAAVRSIRRASRTRPGGSPPGPRACRWGRSASRPGCPSP